MPLRGCGGRSPQAAVAGGEKGGEGITEVFWCLKIPHVQGILDSLTGWNLPWSMCGIRAVILPWSSPGCSRDLSAWRRAATLPSVSSAQVRAWQEGWGLSALISIEVFPGPLRNAAHL